MNLEIPEWAKMIIRVPRVSGDEPIYHAYRPPEELSSPRKRG